MPVYVGKNSKGESLVVIVPDELIPFEDAGEEVAFREKLLQKMYSWGHFNQSYRVVSLESKDSICRLWLEHEDNNNKETYTFFFNVDISNIRAVKDEKEKEAILELPENWEDVVLTDFSKAAKESFFDAVLNNVLKQQKFFSRTYQLAKAGINDQGQYYAVIAAKDNPKERISILLRFKELELIPAEELKKVEFEPLSKITAVKMLEYLHPILQKISQRPKSPGEGDILKYSKSVVAQQRGIKELLDCFSIHKKDPVACVANLLAIAHLTQKGSRYEGRLLQTILSGLRSCVSDKAITKILSGYKNLGDISECTRVLSQYLAKELTDKSYQSFVDQLSSVSDRSASHSSPKSPQSKRGA